MSSVSTAVSRIVGRRSSALGAVRACCATHYYQRCSPLVMRSSISAGTNPIPNHNVDWNTKLFSTQAAVQEEPQTTKSKRRRTLQTKDPIIVTERAADRIKDLLSGENAKGAIGIILGVKRRGCNGLSYTLNYAFEEPKDKGASMTAPHEIKVFIEPMALFNVIGTTMDWEEDEMTSEFTFNNPNSKGECGCGESFNV